MSGSWQPISITRAGSAVAGSPFLVKVRYRRLHVDPQIAPVIARRPIQQFLIFQDILAAVEVGDSVALPDGSTSKIIDVRGYSFSLQCILQRQPYLSTPIWLPAAASAAVQSDKSLGDVIYTAGSPVLASFEPHGIDQPGPLPVGAIDRRSCWVFSAEPIALRSVLQGGSDYWLITASSSVWPQTNDYRAPARRLSHPPLGVS